MAWRLEIGCLWREVGAAGLVWGVGRGLGKMRNRDEVTEGRLEERRGERGAETGR